MVFATITQHYHAVGKQPETICKQMGIAVSNKTWFTQSGCKPDLAHGV